MQDAEGLVQPTGASSWSALLVRGVSLRKRYMSDLHAPPLCRRAGQARGHGVVRECSGAAASAVAAYQLVQPLPDPALVLASGLCDLIWSGRRQDRHSTEESHGVPEGDHESGQGARCVAANPVRELRANVV